jgi:hypothetical protein
VAVLSASAKVDNPRMPEKRQSIYERFMSNGDVFFAMNVVQEQDL